MAKAKIKPIEGYYEDTDLELDEGLRSFVIVEDLNGSSVLRLRKHSDKWDVWDDIIKNPTAQIKLRLGYQENFEQRWGDWKTFIFPQGRSRYYRENVLVGINGIDSGYLLAESYRQKAFLNKRVSDVVKNIADYHDLESDIEETDGLCSLWQCNLSDARFIKHELLQRAVSVKKRYDYNFYFKNGNELIFRPYDVTADIKHNFVFGKKETKQKDDIHINFIDVAYYRLCLVDNKSWSTKFVGFNPTTKQFLKFIANDETVDYKKLAPEKPETNDGFVNICNLSEPDAEFYDKRDFEKTAKCIWSQNFRGRFRIYLKTRYWPEVRLEDIANFEVSDSDDKDHFLSGKYIIVYVKHVFSKGSMETIVFLERRTSR